MKIEVLLIFLNFSLISANKNSCPDGQLSMRLCSLEQLVDSIHYDSSSINLRLDELEAENEIIQLKLEQLLHENLIIKEQLAEITNENLLMSEQLKKVIDRLDDVEEKLLELTTRPCAC